MSHDDPRWKEPDWSELDARRAQLQLDVRAEHPDWIFPNVTTEALRRLVMDGKELICYDQALDDIKGIKLIAGMRLNKKADELEAALAAEAPGAASREMARQIRLAIREMRDLGGKQ